MYASQIYKILIQINQIKIWLHYVVINNVHFLDTIKGEKFNEGHDIKDEEEKIILEDQDLCQANENHQFEVEKQQQDETEDKAEGLETEIHELCHEKQDIE